MTNARWLDLDGTANTRDLGGVRVRDGVVRPNVLIRSDNLQSLSPRDVDRLVDDLGLRSVLDVRTTSERADEGPGPLAARSEVKHFGLSFIPETPAVAQDPGSVLPSRWAHGPVVVYTHYLQQRPESFKAAIERLADPEAGAAIVHCAAGKDRTGVLVALILDVLGADDEDIVGDYVRTNERIEAIFTRLRGSATYAEDVVRIGLDAHRVDPDTMREVLRTLRRTYGSGEDYLLAAGVSAATLRGLHERLVEPSAAQPGSR